MLLFSEAGIFPLGAYIIVSLLRQDRSIRFYILFSSQKTWHPVILHRCCRFNSEHPVIFHRRYRNGAERNDNIV